MSYLNTWDQSSHPNNSLVSTQRKTVFGKKHTVYLHHHQSSDLYVSMSFYQNVLEFICSKGFIKDIVSNRNNSRFTLCSK